jgi:hypothetical protein
MNFVLVVDFFPEIVRLRILPVQPFLDGTGELPFTYARDKYTRARDELEWACQKRKSTSYRFFDSRENPPHHCGGGIVTFANFLDNDAKKGYTIFSMNMRHDSNGNDLLSEVMMRAMTRCSGFTESLSKILPSEIAIRLLGRRQVSLDVYKPIDSPQKKKKKLLPRPSEARSCKYILF